MAMGAFHGEADGDAAAVGEDAPCGAHLPAVGRMLAHLFPPSGALVIAPSIASHPNQCLYGLVCHQAVVHNARQTPAAVHSWKRRWAARLEQRPVAFSAFHWHPVRSTKKMASMA